MREENARGAPFLPGFALRPGTMWRRLVFKETTGSTNADAAGEPPGTVVCADAQTAGAGRIGHKWHSPPGVNLYFSAVVDCAGMEPAQAAVFPLVAGAAVCAALERCAEGAGARFMLKWPNDVLADGRKICGILCERRGDSIVAGIGINANQKEFPPDIAGRAVSLALVRGAPVRRGACLGAALDALEAAYREWKERGFAAIHREIARRDWLKGKTIAVRQTDADAAPVRGECAGIAPDGALLVCGHRIYAGEAHVEMEK